MPDNPHDTALPRRDAASGWGRLAVASSLPSMAGVRAVLLLGAIPVLVMLFVGLFRLGNRSLTLDETTSYFLTQIGWGRFFEVVADSKANMSLYFATLRLWPFTGDEVGLRSMSVLFGALTVLPFVAIARRFLPTALTIAAAVMLAVNPLFLVELRDARGYALAVLLCVTGTWLLLVALESSRAWAWIAYACAMGLALYAHFLTGLVLVAHLVLLATVRFLPLRPAAIAAAAIITAAAIPVAVVVVVQGGSTLTGVDPPTWESVVASLTAVAGSEAALGIYVVAFVVGAVLWLDPRGPGRHATAWRAVYLAGLLTLVLTVIVSLIKPILVDRYLVIAVPFVILGALGASNAVSTRLAAVVAAVLLVVTGLGAYSQLTLPFERPAGWVRQIVAGAAPGDGVIFDDEQDRKVLAYYLEDPQASWLRVVGSTNPITVNPYTETAPPAQPGPGLRGTLAEMPCRYERVWFVGGPGNLDRPRDLRARLITTALTDSYTRSEGERHGNRWVRLFERQPGAAC